MQFYGTPIKKIFDNNTNFRIYACNVNAKKFPAVEKNKYGNVSIAGDLPDLDFDREYNITAEPKDSKYGVTYNVKSIKVDKPRTLEEVRAFLTTIIPSENHVNELLNSYPNIIDLILSGKENDVDLSKLNGIGEYYFAKIRNAIIQNFRMYDLLTYFEGTLPFSIVQQLDKDYSSIDVIKRELNKDPYKFFTKISHVGFIKADQAVLSLAEAGKLKDKNIKNSPLRCKACISYLLCQNEDLTGSTMMDLFELSNALKRLVGVTCSKHAPDVIKDEKEFYLDVQAKCLTRRVVYEEECYIVEKIKNAIANNKQYDIDYTKYINSGEFPLSDEQSMILKYACEKQVMILDGPAGSGKSFSMSALIKMLDDNKLSYILMSPTAKAAKVLSSYTNKHASTIHKALGYSQNGFMYGKNDPLTEKVVVVDEFSMVSQYLMVKLLDAIDFRYTKLIMIGDSNQLPSVGCGNILHDFLHSNIIPTVSLTKIFRYGTSGLLTAATDIRNQKMYLDKSEDKAITIGQDNDYTFIQTQDETMLQNVVNVYKKLIQQGYKPDDIMVLSCYNRGKYGVDEVNKLLHPIANSSTENQEKYIEVVNGRFCVGDNVMQTENNYHATMVADITIIKDDNGIDHKEVNINGECLVANGETGVITDIFDNSIIINFSGTDILYHRSDMEKVKLAYAFTVHKSQGSSAKIVLVMMPKAHTYMLNSNLLYVAVTRTSKKCFHFGNYRTLKNALRKKEDYSRKTNIEKLLLTT